MKTHPTICHGSIRMIFCLAVVGALLFSGMAYADGNKSGPVVVKAEKKKPAKTAKVMVTGSNVPQDASQLGRIPTTTSPMLIIGRTEMDRSGQSTVADVLRRLPIAR